MNTDLERNYSHLRFLVVDDKPFIRAMVQSMLLRVKAREVVYAANGEEAIKALHKHGGKIDCVLSDWNMEPISGLELLRAIRTGGVPFTAPELRFIMLTGHADAPVVQTALDLDVHGYLVKPISLEKFVKAIDSALARPIAVKPARHYSSVNGVGVPSRLRESTTKNSGWVVWNQASSKRAAPDEQAPAIRNEASAVNQNPVDVPTIKNRRRSAVADVPPTAVLAEDIRDADGTLLVASGTQLNINLLTRIRSLVSKNEREPKLWIGDR